MIVMMAVRKAVKIHNSYKHLEIYFEMHLSSKWNQTFSGLRKLAAKQKIRQFGYS